MKSKYEDEADSQRFIHMKPILMDLSRHGCNFPETNATGKSTFSCGICLITLQYLRLI